ncbi:MAG: NUDIX domain-containing protein [bacterium]|nr:NUDIX domain-containing protein [bacterium]
MKLRLTPSSTPHLSLTDEDIAPYVSFIKLPSYELRQTVKVVVRDSEKRIALVTSLRHGLYLLPGGGTETNDLQKEAERECEEEINFNVKILDVVATADEFRNNSGKKYETTCFSAKILSESPSDTRTEHEKVNDLRVEWFTRVEALDIAATQKQKLVSGDIEFYNIKFNILRDGFFIECFYEREAHVKNSLT